MKTYTLIENGVIHTDDLDQESAQEMLSRHQRFFPNERWEILESASVQNFDRGMSLVERQKYAYR